MKETKGKKTIDNGKARLSVLTNNKSNSKKKKG